MHRLNRKESLSGKDSPSLRRTRGGETLLPEILYIAIAQTLGLIIKEAEARCGHLFADRS